MSQVVPVVLAQVTLQLIPRCKQDSEDKCAVNDLVSLGLLRDSSQLDHSSNIEKVVEKFQPRL